MANLPVTLHREVFYMKKWEIAVLAGFVLAVLITNFVSFAETCGEVRGDTLRLHILANSDSEEDQAEKLAILKETWEAYEEILKDQDCLSLKDLKINGNQLKALGIREGKVIGTILNTLLSMVLEHPELNEYSYLKELALKIYRQLR